MIVDPAEAAPSGMTPRWVVNCPLIWAGRAGLDIETRPLRLVLFSQPCSWRDTLLAALNQAGIPWQVVFESSSLQAVQAAVKAGLGVTALLPGTLPAGVRPLSEFGLPGLPAIHLGLFQPASRAADGVTQQLSRWFYREISIMEPQLIG